MWYTLGTVKERIIKEMTFVIIILVLVVIVFAAMGFGIGYSGKESIISGIVGAVIAVAIMVLFIGACLGQNKAEIEYYNNGICTICGGEYEFAGGSRYRNHSEYYYTCENCGHTITTSSIMK